MSFIRVAKQTWMDEDDYEEMSGMTGAKCDIRDDQIGDLDWINSQFLPNRVLMSEVWSYLVSCRRRKDVLIEVRLRLRMAKESLSDEWLIAPPEICVVHFTIIFYYNIEECCWRFLDFKGYKMSTSYGMRGHSQLLFFVTRQPGWRLCETLF